MNWSFGRVALLCSAAAAVQSFGCGPEVEDPLEPGEAEASLAGAPAAAPPARAGRLFEIDGELELIVVDDFAGGRSWLELRVRDASGEVYELDGFDEETLPSGLRHGATVRARGRLVDGAQRRLERDQGGSIELLAAPQQLALTGVRNTLVVVANFIDGDVLCSNADIEDRLFGPTNSVTGVYEEMSDGLLRFAGQVIGPYQLDASAGDPCNTWGHADKLDKQLKRSGYDLRSYQHVMYVFPWTNCGYAGVAFLGGNRSAIVGSCTQRSTIAHELGHNLGLHHAATPSYEYGDSSDFMGTTSGRLVHLNAPHRIQMGWLDSSSVVEVSAPGQYTVAPLALDESVTGGLPQVLRVRKPGSASDFLLSYRQPVGYDAYLSLSNLNGIHVHSHAGGMTQTNLVARLLDGASFTEPAQLVSITQLAHDPTGVTIQVDFVADTQAPSAPGGLAASITQQKKNYAVGLGWTASTDDVGIAGYDVLRNGAVIGSASTLTFVDSKVTKGTTYSYSVRARDTSGNVSADAASVSVAIPSR